MRRIFPKTAAGLMFATIGFGLLGISIRECASFLVVDNREKSDTIVITQADSLDAAYWMALRLLNSGYGRDVLLDARTDRMFFGRSEAQWADEFIRKTASLPDHVRVCPITADTTAEEVYEVGNCLKERPIQSVLLVVSDFHSRRSLEMFSRLLPAYRWSIASIPDSARFGTSWWRRRVWIRTTAVEWQHMLWWELIDRWRCRLVAKIGRS
jgi:uncharacterized SAM-binding protein YcdF (DUF218 family)